MLLLLALFGCNPGPTDVDGSVVHPPDPLPTHASAAPPQIATRRPTHAAAARVAPKPPPIPTGQAIYTDCGAGPWPPRTRHRDTVLDGEIARKTAPTRPRPKPTYRPAPQPAPMPMHTPPPPADAASAPSTPTPDAVAPVGSAGAIGGGGSNLQVIRGAESSGQTRSSGDEGGAASPGYGRDGGASSGPVSKAEAAKPVAEAPPPEAEPVAVDKTVADAPRASEDTKDLAKVGYLDDRAGEGDISRNREAKNTKEKRDANLRWDDDADADPAEIATGADEEDEEWTTTEEAKPREMWDYGATVHLSNDDSMSLASAQRVLWSVMNHRRPKLSEIRPHELLNYFSFDTVPVAEDQMFSVLGAAEAQGDTLSVALAVKGATPPRQPLDLTIAVDRSGSMAAEGRMSYTVRGLTQMVDRLHAGDRIDLVTFESRVCTPLQDFVVGRDDPALLRHAMKSLYPKGSTDLDGGLKEAYRIQTERSAADSHGRNRRVMLITDAFLNTGSVDPDVVSEIGKSFDDHRIRLTGVGVGREFNDEVLDKLTEKGKGAYVYLGSEAVVDRVFGAGFDSLVQTIAHDVRFSIHLPPSLAMQRFYGEEASTDAADIQPINYYAGTSQVFLQDLHIREGGLVDSDPLMLRIAWRDATTGEPDSLELHTTVGALVDGEVRNLHKAQALMAWSDWVMGWASGGYRNAVCSGPMELYAERAAKVADDAELAFLSDLTGGVCGRPVVAAPKVAYKVRLDSDIPIAEVGLQCGSRTWSERLSGGDTVARFADARAGACTLTLQGQVAMRAPVEVPKTGGDVRCTIRGGRLTCS